MQLPHCPFGSGAGLCNGLPVHRTSAKSYARAGISESLDLTIQLLPAGTRTPRVAATPGRPMGRPIRGHSLKPTQ